MKSTSLADPQFYLYRQKMVKWVPQLIKSVFFFFFIANNWTKKFLYGRYGQNILVHVKRKIEELGPGLHKSPKSQITQLLANFFQFLKVKSSLVEYKMFPLLF